MFRSIVIGKLVISIIASLIVGYLCWNTSRLEEKTTAESWQWIALSLFFFGLAICFMVVIHLLFYRKKRP